MKKVPSRAHQTKYIFVTGGVLSGVGKGIAAASLGTILKACGFKLNIQKCDPYLNVDAGTLNPAEHGECFVTRDGAETDLDLGHYERFLNIELNQASSLMNGRIFREVIEDEREGVYLGKTVQIIPHITNHIQKRIIEAGKDADVHIVEIGGTVGDYESLAFIEAIRELAMRVGPENCLFAHVVYLPYLGTSGEFKTKPAQNSVRDLRGLGIVPDILIARSEIKPPRSVVSKLALFSGIEEEAIFLLPNAETIYQVPLTLQAGGLANITTERLGLRRSQPDLSAWRKMVRAALTNYRKSVRVGVIAKYVDNQDTYKSVFEALQAAAWSSGANIKIEWISAEDLPDDTGERDKLAALDAIVVPGGFGPRGIEGKILAATYALENKVPYLGLCLGLQVAVIAAARKAGLAGANSTEFNRGTKYPVISTMAEQVGKENTGGTMRLGDYTCELSSGTKSRKVYGSAQVVERHRHRYEASNQFRGQYEKWGIKVSGTSPDDKLVEMIEALDHPYFLATQAHPEFKSRPNRPHPLFMGLISATLAKK